ncbi:MAG: hypothetical protein ABGW75_12535, partial [Pirellulales bacterium]
MVSLSVELSSQETVAHESYVRIFSAHTKDSSQEESVLSTRVNFDERLSELDRSTVFNEHCNY